MPQITIPCVMDGDKPVLLLTDVEKQRLEARIADLTAQSAEYKKASLPEESTSLKIAANALRDELARNEQLVSAGDLKTYTVTFDEPTLEDLAAVRTLLATDVGAAKQTAYERLNPQCEEWGKVLPMRFYPAVSEACFGEIFPDLSEDRRFFSMRLQSRQS